MGESRFQDSGTHFDDHTFCPDIGDDTSFTLNHFTIESASVNMEPSAEFNTCFDDADAIKMK